MPPDRPAPRQPTPRPSDPRIRLGVALVLGFGFAAVQDLRLAPAMLATAAAVTMISGPGLAPLGRRLRAPGLFALGVLAILPLTVGQTPLATVGPLTIRAEGVSAALLIATRLLCIVAVVAAMLAPLAPLDLVRAARGLGVPAILADLALLTLRYLDEVRDEAARMRRAMALRGGRPGLRRLGALGWLLAALMLRSHDRADRQWRAMRLRGHGAAAVDAWPPIAHADRLALGAAVVAALGLALA